MNHTHHEPTAKIATAPKDFSGHLSLNVSGERQIKWIISKSARRISTAFAQNGSGVVERMIPTTIPP